MRLTRQFLRPVVRLAMLAMLAAILTPAARPATWGKVVALGGHAADVALDESRGVLYVANYTANRVDVVSAPEGSVQTSFNIASQPSSLALSPDSRHLVVAHYGNFTTPGSVNNSLTVIDLITRARQTFSLGLAPLGVAFGIDGRALVVTSGDFFLFDPVTGVTQTLGTIGDVAAKTLPVPPVNFPPNIVEASMAASRDGREIYGLTNTFTFRYSVNTRLLRIQGYVSEPPLGPRVVSVNRDGSFYLAGWAMHASAGHLVAQFPEPNGALHVGGHAFDVSRGLVYAQVPRGTDDSALEEPPVLQVLDADNLRVFERIQLAENLAGKGVLDSSASYLYAISDSGITILPVGLLAEAPKVRTNAEDLVYRGNFCDRRMIAHEVSIEAPGGTPVDFRLTSDTPGVLIEPSSGMTPAVVRISVDPSAFQNSKGTKSIQVQITSARAVNVPDPIRLLVNNREPDQRGTFVNVPGKIVDILADPYRERFFLLRQDTNEVLVYDGANYNLITRLKTGNTPTQMAITFDQRWLLVANDNSQIANVYDLETLYPSQPIIFPFGHYPRSIAASGKAILAATRVAGPIHVIDRVDMATRRATQLPSLGVWENDIDLNTVLVASGNGGSILAAQADGHLLLYNANVDSFTISRKYGTELSGAYGASSFDFFGVGHEILNASLVPVRRLDNGLGQSSGVSFVDDWAIRTAAPNGESAGVIQRLAMGSGDIWPATRMAEAPILGNEGAAFTRTLAPLYSRNVLVNLTTSGFTVLPWNYDAAVAPPRLDRVLNAADSTPGMAPGSLISLYGEALSPVNIATREIPLPTALGESCLTINGIPSPVLFVSPAQVNAQVPYQLVGNVTLVLRTPGGVSDNYNLTILPGAPAVFRGVAETPSGYLEYATIMRKANGQPATLANPLRVGDQITIYLTGLGSTNPAVETGAPASGPAPAIVPAAVTIGGVPIPIHFAGLSPGMVGVYQIDAEIPGAAPTGVDLPLVITQGGYSTTLRVRVIKN